MPLDQKDVDTAAQALFSLFNPGNSSAQQWSLKESLGGKGWGFDTPLMKLSSFSLYRPEIKPKVKTFVQYFPRG